MSGEREYYDILGLSRDAVPEEIRKAYFEAARRLHPDANPEPTAGERFLAVQKAYEILSNPDRRYEYDQTLPPQVIDPSITLTLQYSCSVLPRLSEPQVAYVLMDLSCVSEPDRSKLPPLNICLVIDRSTSMKGERMDMVKANAEQLLKKLAPKDIISLVAFSDRAEVIIPPTRIMDLTKVSERISMIDTNGGTEIYQGLEAGMNLLRLRGTKAFTRHMILITDGHTYGDEQACLELAKEAAMEGIVFSTMGIGHEWNDNFLDQLAGLSGGTSMFVSSPHDLQKYMEAKLASFDMLYARGISFEYDTGTQAKLRYAFRLQPEVGTLPMNNPTALGNLQYGKSQLILFEYVVQEVPKEQDFIQISTGRLKMEIPSDNKTLHFSLNFRRPVSSNMDPELPPPVIVDAMSRLTLYRLQERARKEVESGDIAQATKHLQYLATHLLSQGDRELAHTVLVEAEHIQQSHQFSKDGDKRIKYGTRALLLPSGLEQGK